MSAYTLEFTPTAQKEFDQVPAKQADRILLAIRRLADEPRPHGSKKPKFSARPERSDLPSLLSHRGAAMPSPFPGMDPYLEAQPFWNNLHSTMIVMLQGELKRRLPSKYTVWSDIYIWLHEPDGETRRGKPDDFVTSQGSTANGSGLLTLPAPSTTILPVIRREGNKYLKIKELRNERVITVLELLSPTNKTSGEDYDAFLAKRNEYLATRTNVVEVDLHRTGKRMPLGRPAPPMADYYAFVSRASDFPQTAIWPFSVRDPLPEVAVPLKPEDGFIMLPLKAAFDAAYDVGPYDTAVDYSRPPKIPLKGKDALWAKTLLKSVRNGL